MVIGRWIRKNEEAVYGIGHSPYRGNLSGLKPEQVIIRSTASLRASADIEIPVPGTYTIKMKLKDDISQYFPLRQGRIRQKQ